MIPVQFLNVAKRGVSPCGPLNVRLSHMGQCLAILFTSVDTTRLLGVESVDLRRLRWLKTTKLSGKQCAWQGRASCSSWMTRSRSTRPGSARLPRSSQRRPHGFRRGSLAGPRGSRARLTRCQQPLYYCMSLSCYPPFTSVNCHTASGPDFSDAFWQENAEQLKPTAPRRTGRRKPALPSVAEEEPVPEHSPPAGAQEEEAPVQEATSAPGCPEEEQRSLPQAQEEAEPNNAAAAPPAAGGTTQISYHQCQSCRLIQH